MFAEPGPRLFGLPPGVDFADCLVRGLVARMAGAPPEAMARVTLWLNSRRMARRVRAVFAARGARVLPRLRLVTDLSQGILVPDLPPPVSALRRRLELAQAVQALLDAEPEMAPRTALYDLADSLADLLDEMEGEGVAPGTIAALDVSEHSAHWQRTQAFMTLLEPYFAATGAPDAQARQRMVMERAEAIWRADPPRDPVIVAGSSGSRGTTARLMRAVAGLPQGALVLPGFDFDMPGAVWDGLDDALTAEDHPQYRAHRLMEALSLSPLAVRPWVDTRRPTRGEIDSSPSRCGRRRSRTNGWPRGRRCPTCARRPAP